MARPSALFAVSMKLVQILSGYTPASNLRDYDIGYPVRGHVRLQSSLPQSVTFKAIFTKQETVLSPRLCRVTSYE